MKDLPETAGVREFGRLLGFRPGYVTQLRKDGRLVLTDDAKRIRVAESIQRIESTRDPAKAAVAERHAAARARKSAAAEQPPEETADPDPQPSTGYSYWRERTERAKALGAERDNAIADGKLMAANDVTSAVSRAVAVLRNRFESLPDILTPQLAPISDEAKTRTAIADAIEHALAEASREFNALAREPA